MCTLKSFPNRIEHTLPWAREYFEEVFKQTPDNCNRFLADAAEFQSYLQSQSNTKLDILQKVSEALIPGIKGRPAVFADCIAWARWQFQELFHNKILQLLYALPLDKKSDDGTPFW